MDENTIVAYEMNGQPLPHFKGFPVRLIVPGWTGTYWMKHLTNIDVLTKPQGGFRMNPAYRIPVGKFPVRERFITQEARARVWRRGRPARSPFRGAEWKGLTSSDRWAE